MKKDNYIVAAYIISIFAIGLSIIAIVLSSNAISNKLLETDWASVLVGILGALATILIGWQLFNVISFERRIISLENKIKAEINEELVIIKEEIREKLVIIKEDAKRQNATSTYRSMYITCCDAGRYNKAFNSLILSITGCLSLNNLTHDESIYDYELKYLNELIVSDKLSYDQPYTEDDIQSYCNSLLKLQSEKALPIINFLKSIKVKE